MLARFPFFTLYLYLQRLLFLGLVPLIFGLWILYERNAEIKQWIELRKSQFSHSAQDESQNQSPPPTTATVGSDESVVDEAATREAFIDAILSSTLTGGFNGTAIKAWCDDEEKVWMDDVALDAVIYGGIGNVRNDVLLTIRYAIEAGVGIISPVIEQRDPNLIKIDTGNGTDLSYMFDQEAFEARIKWACPRMPIHKTLADFEKLGPMKTISTTPRDLPQENGPVTSIKSDLIERKGAAGEVTRAIFYSPLGYLPVCVDGEDFVDNVGQLIPFRKDAQYLAAAVLYELCTRFNITMNPHGGISPHAFLGIHLRTESDAVAAGFSSYDVQAPYYLSIAAARGLPATFMASGDAITSAKFVAQAAALSPPITVVTKTDLLRGADLARLKALNFDQQALVDYLVLLRASYFAGVAASSYSANVAMRRRVLSKAGSCGPESAGRADDVAFRDEFSELFGVGHSEWAEKMFP